MCMLHVCCGSTCSTCIVTGVSDNWSEVADTRGVGGPEAIQL